MRGRPLAFPCFPIATGRSPLEPCAARNFGERSPAAMSDAAPNTERSDAAATLVVELVTEELPPKALKTLGAAFAETLASELRQRGLFSAHSAVTAFATPRRLA